MEGYLARTRYKGITFVGNLKGGTYTLIDFVNDKTGLGVSPATKKGKETFIKEMKVHIDKLDGLRTAGKHPDDGRLINNVRLDIGVKQGADASWLKEVKDYGDSVEVKIFEVLPEKQ